MRSAALVFFLIFIFFTVTAQQVHAQNLQVVTLSGELKKWHKVTLTFDGPNTSETNSDNPFLNYRLQVEFTAPSGKKVMVPGYYAAEGNAAETSANSGNKWRAHLAPDETGTWTYKASFRKGTDIAVSLDSNAGTPVSFDGTTGNFVIQNTDKYGRDLRAKGMLRYVNKRYLQFAETGEYFVKAGPDSPENLLAYEDFDNTPNLGGYLKNYGLHHKDWKTSDPKWQGNKGTELVGALNYLADKGLNVFAFLTMNIKGDDKNVYPYISETDFNRMDVSKLDQWEIMFSHADKVGLFMNFKTQETENDQLLNNGDLGTQRKLYYRELIARFGHHLALSWNLGEENTNTTSQLKNYAQYFKDLDPYDHHIVVHNNLKIAARQEQINLYGPLINGQSLVTGTSIQTHWYDVLEDTAYWVQQTANSSQPWVIANDEQAPAAYGVPPDSGNKTSSYNQDSIRKEVLWGNLMHGGAGVEYYFGYDLEHSDLTLQDFRSRDTMWNYSRHALEFFNNHVPFWDMNNNNGITSNTSDYVMAKPGVVYAVYLPQGGTTTINLPSGNYTVKWYDPRNGGNLQNGSVTQMSGGNSSIGNPPNSAGSDWAVLIQNTQHSSSCQGDLNTDSRIDLLDFLLLIPNFFSSNPSPASADINRDGEVNLVDYTHYFLPVFFTDC